VKVVRQYLMRMKFGIKSSSSRDQRKMTEPETQHKTFVFVHCILLRLLLIIFWGVLLLFIMLLLFIVIVINSNKNIQKNTVAIDGNPKDYKHNTQATQYKTTQHNTVSFVR
jgi:cell division septal protein FtsQ